jgi:hypothetical protein
MVDEPVTSDAVIAEARRWLGTPWRHQGRTRAGVDCAGLVVMVARTLGLADYDAAGYSRRASGFDFVRHFQAAMESVRVAEAMPGDVLVFADGAYPCHCGFLSLWQDHPHLIHAHVSRRQVVEEPYIGEWPGSVRFAFRFHTIAAE